MSTVTTSEKVEKFVASLGIPEGVQLNAYERLLELDFPTTRDEYWKYTRLGKITNNQFQLAKGTALDSKESFQHLIVCDDYLVVENGVFREELSHTGSIVAEWISAAEASNFSSDVRLNQVDIFNQLNDAYLGEALRISGEGIIQIIYLDTANTSLINHRVQVTVGKSSAVKIIQTFGGEGTQNFVNSVGQYHVEENAQCEVHLLQNFAETTSSISTTEVFQAQNSTFRINTATVSGLLVRNNINIAVAGQNCQTYMNGIVVTKGKMHVDNHTFVDHKVSNCESNENYKYVLNDNTTGVFNGKVIVRPDAQVINAYQNNGNIILSDQASINSKPELEIYADDVKCSHGSTTGQLDEDALFYLQSRGISKKAAKEMLVAAFISEVIEEIEDESMIQLIESAIQKEHGWNF